MRVDVAFGNECAQSSFFALVELVVSDRHANGEVQPERGELIAGVMGGVGGLRGTFHIQIDIGIRAAMLKVARCWAGGVCFPPTWWL